ncbi:MAG TPA: trypsin-like peptidase domain-containing protein [Dongiaceae bacterium]|nr:trypsin-like peptidase domain-containing protein [Dongiaceae bacterium]
MPGYSIDSNGVRALRTRGAGALLALAGGLVAAAPAPAPGPAAPAAGRLEARVAVVLADLSVRPVPKQKFVVVPAAGGAPLAVTTAFDGTLAQPFPPGRYRIQSENPLEFEGKRLTWDVEFEVRPGATTSLELSNDNARTEPAAGAAAAGGATPGTAGATDANLDAGVLYERYRAGVFKIVAAGGHGSGFLVAPEGLILTNHHVIEGASYLAARIDERHKYAVTVIADDAEHDVAVLRIHPDTVRGLPVLPLAGDRPGGVAVAVGDRVVAIGSPLTAETILTQGVVSKVQQDRLISDVNINPGNSGGPLLDRRGDVIGISTYGIESGSGPGLSGITRIGVAAPALATAREKLAGSEIPSSRPLPVEPAWRFDPAAIKKDALASERKLEDYQMKPGKIEVGFLTPVFVASRLLQADREAKAAHQKRRKDAEPAPPADTQEQKFYAWQKDDDNFRAVVFVRAFPQIKMTAGSKWKMGFTGRGGKFQFEADFDRMELRRGGELVEPILPGRIKEVVNVTGPSASLQDVVYWGLYEYPPEAFKEGAELVLRVWEQGVAEPQVLPLSDGLVTKIRADYRDYFAANSASAP